MKMLLNLCRCVCVCVYVGVRMCTHVCVYERTELLSLLSLPSPSPLSGPSGADVPLQRVSAGGVRVCPALQAGHPQGQSRQQGGRDHGVHVRPGHVKGEGQWAWFLSCACHVTGVWCHVTSDSPSVDGTGSDQGLDGGFPGHQQNGARGNIVRITSCQTLVPAGVLAIM